MTRNNKALLVAAVVVIAAIAYFKTRETPVEDKLSRMIQFSVDAANAKNQQAVSLCESEINAMLAQQFPEVTRQGLLAAQDIASYGSCCKIIYSLARDKIKSSIRPRSMLMPECILPWNNPSRSCPATLKLPLAALICH